MTPDAAERLQARLHRAREILKSVRLKPYVDASDVFVPQNRPEDFAHLVHFFEGLYEAMTHLQAFCDAQGVHEEGDIDHVMVQFDTLAREARAYWEEYKSQAGIVAVTQ